MSQIGKSVVGVVKNLCYSCSNWPQSSASREFYRLPVNFLGLFSCHGKSRLLHARRPSSRANILRQCQCRCQNFRPRGRQREYQQWEFMFWSSYSKRLSADVKGYKGEHKRYNFYLRIRLTSQLILISDLRRNKW